MPSERIQFLVETLLNDATESVNFGEWPEVEEKARAVLAIAPQHADALALLQMAQANDGGSMIDESSEGPSTEQSPSQVTVTPEKQESERVQRDTGTVDSKSHALASVGEQPEADVIDCLPRPSGDPGTAQTPESGKISSRGGEPSAEMHDSASKLAESYNCANCGTDLAPGIRHCPSCGLGVSRSSWIPGVWPVVRERQSKRVPRADGLMSPANSIRTCFSKYVDFSGRATRAEYWWWVLIMGVGINVLGLFLGQNASNEMELSLWDGAILVYLIVSIGLFPPGFAVAVRRLHDVNESGWWLLVPIVNVAFLVKRGSPGTNSYGPPA